MAEQIGTMQVARDTDMCHLPRSKCHVIKGSIEIKIFDAGTGTLQPVVEKHLVLLGDFRVSRREARSMMEIVIVSFDLWEAGISY